MSSTFEEIYNEIVESSRGNLTNEEYRELITLEYVVTQGYDKVGDVERLNELRSQKRGIKRIWCTDTPKYRLVIKR